MRCVPHDQDTGGFFICLLRKTAPIAIQVTEIEAEEEQRMREQAKERKAKKAADKAQRKRKFDEERLQRESKKRQRKRDHSPPERFGFGDARDEEEVQYDEATGCRLVDLDLFNENITRLLPCPRC